MNATDHAAYLAELAAGTLDGLAPFRSTPAQVWSGTLAGDWAWEQGIRGDTAEEVLAEIRARIVSVLEAPTDENRETWNKIERKFRQAMLSYIASGRTAGKFLTGVRRAQVAVEIEMGLRWADGAMKTSGEMSGDPTSMRMRAELVGAR